MHAEVNLVAKVLERGVVQVALFPLEVSLVLLSLVVKLLLVSSFPLICLSECVPVYAISFAFTLGLESVLVGDLDFGQQLALFVLLCSLGSTLQRRLP